MRKYLYAGKSADGSARRGYVEAESVADARGRVESQGISDYVLLDDDNTATLRASMEEAGFESDADVDLLSRYHPSALGLMALSARKNAVSLVIVAGFAAALYTWGYTGWAAALALVCAGSIAFPGWVQAEQNAVYRRFWAGDYAGSMASAGRVRRFASLMGLQASMLEMDSRIAGSLVKLGRGDEARARIGAWKGSDKVPATVVMTKQADLRFLSRDYAGYLAAMEEIFRATGEADYAKIDLGQVMARVGDDDERATALLASVDNTAMGPLHHAFTDWGRGVLALRARRDDEALALLTGAVDAMQPMVANPITWGALSLSTAYLSVAMARTGRREAAAQMFAPVRAIAEWHGEDRLLGWLREEGLVGKQPA